MNLGIPDQRDSLRTQQELTKQRETVINLMSLSVAQLMQNYRSAKGKDRDKTLKALMAKLLNSFKSICSKGVSSADAVAISSLGNDIDSAVDKSAGDTAKASVK